MKIRNGFVSNSSSSSFIIAYKKRVEDKKLHSKSFYDILSYHSVDTLACDKESLLELVEERIKDEKFYFGGTPFWSRVKDKVNKETDDCDVMFFEVERGDSMLEIIMSLYIEKGYLNVLEKWEG